MNYFNFENTSYVKKILVGELAFIIAFLLLLLLNFVPKGLSYSGSLYFSLLALFVLAGSIIIVHFLDGHADSSVKEFLIPSFFYSISLALVKTYIDTSAENAKTLAAVNVLKKSGSKLFKDYVFTPTVINWQFLLFYFILFFIITLIGIKMTIMFIADKY